MFFPPLVSCLVLDRFGHKNGAAISERAKRGLTAYIVHWLVIQAAVMLLLRVLGYNFQMPVFVRMNAYPRFAIRYLAAALMLAGVLPLAELWLKKRLPAARGGAPAPRRVAGWLLWAVAAAGFAMHFIRIFDEVLSNDELLPSCAVAQVQSLHGLLTTIASWGHVPLHYIIVWLTDKAFGLPIPLLHFISLVPYLLILLLALTTVQRRHGRPAALVLMLLCTLLDLAVRYNVEVRMYSLCQLFILLVYLAAWRVFVKRDERALAMMTLWSLGAVYSHSFAIAFVGLLYACLCCYYLKTDARHIWKPILSGTAVLAGFAPWLISTQRLRGEAVAHYGQIDLTLKTCFQDIFSTKAPVYCLILWGIFCIVFLLAAAYSTGIATWKKGDRGQKKRAVCTVRFTGIRVSPELVWIFSGVFAVIGEILAMYVFGLVAYPIVQRRYLYACYVVIWLLMGVCISKCHFRKTLTLCVSVLLLAACLPTYIQTVKTERHIYEDQKQTLAATAEINADSSRILAAWTYQNWTVTPYYYPGVPITEFKETQELILSQDDCWVLFYGRPLTEEETAQIAAQGYEPQPVVENGYLGNYKVWIYKTVEQVE